MTPEDKLQHTQAEAKRVANMLPEQKQEVKKKHSQTLAKWREAMTSEDKLQHAQTEAKRVENNPPE